MAHIAGIRSGSSIVPYSQATKRTKEYNLTFSNTPAGWSLKQAIGVAYADSDDNWSLWFSISAVANTNTALGADIDGILARNTTAAYQMFYAGRHSSLGTTSDSKAQINPNDNTLSISHATSDTGYYVEGVILLESEPTWAAANMEASTDASIHIEPATSTQAGLIPSFLEDTYTPSFSDLSGQTAAVDTPAIFHYTKIGNTVWVWGEAQIDQTAAGQGFFDISLPVSSTFTNEGDLGGTIGINDAGYSPVGWMSAKVADGEARCSIDHASANDNRPLYFNFQYRVL